jgi:stage II sporulation protein AB (anti-sigma F factor)
MKPINTIKIEFESRSVNESFARSAVSAFAAQLDPTIDELCDIKTAVSEAVTNSVVHAYPDRLGKVYISAAIYPDRRLVIKIRDLGCGISDVKKAMEPLFTTGADDERSGLGFSVMQSLTDKVRVRSKIGGPTTVTLEKKLCSKGEKDGSL